MAAAVEQRHSQQQQQQQPFQNENSRMTSKRSAGHLSVNHDGSTMISVVNPKGELIPPQTHRPWGQRGFLFSFCAVNGHTIAQCNHLNAKIALINFS